jgi:hypothetical protein
VLEAVKVWPGKGGTCHEVGATANLDSSCARRPGAAAGRDEETGFSDRTKKLMKDKRCAGVPKLLDKKSPIQGTMDFRIGNEKRTMKAGDVAVIPGGVEHEAVTPPARRADEIGRCWPKVSRGAPSSWTDSRPFCRRPAGSLEKGLIGGSAVD